MASLRDLTVAEAVKQFLESESPGKDFEALEPVQQKLIFMHLLSERSEYSRALAAERRFQDLKVLMPGTDLSIYRGRHRIEQPENLEDDEGPEGRAQQFRAEWSYTRKDDSYSGPIVIFDSHPTDGEIHWHSYDLYSEGPESELKVRNQAEMISLATTPIWRRISSQLLLYRLLALFGTPLFLQADGYKSCWGTGLVSSDKKSKLTLRDMKGAPSALFKSTEEGSKSALSLLNFLLEVEMPHTYDGTIAGTQA